MSLEAFAHKVVRDYLTDSLEYSRVYEDNEILEAELDDDQMVEILGLAQSLLDQVAEWFDGV